MTMLTIGKTFQGLLLYVLNIYEFLAQFYIIFWRHGHQIELILVAVNSQYPFSFYLNNRSIHIDCSLLINSALGFKK